MRVKRRTRNHLKTINTNPNEAHDPRQQQESNPWPHMLFEEKTRVFVGSDFPTYTVVITDPFDTSCTPSSHATDH